jgi:hypothetical protein
MGGARTYARNGKGDQSGPWIGAILSDDERAAVGGDAALLGAVVARLHGELPGLAAGGHGHRVVTATGVEVPEAGGHGGDRQQGHDPCGREAARAL